jgi:DNA-binding HxlR family transcriptional regulator
MNEECQDFAADCRVRLATDLLAHRWDPVVLLALKAGRRRRVDLLGAIGGISDKVLFQALSRLTANGLVKRVASSGDRAVAYELSELGESLTEGPLAALGRWATDRGDEVLAAQDRQAPPRD